MKQVQFDNSDDGQVVHALKFIQRFEGTEIAWCACGCANEVAKLFITEGLLDVTCGTCLRSKWYRKETEDAGTASDLSGTEEH